MGKKLTSLLLLMFFLHGIVLNGVVLTRTLPAVDCEITPSIVALDVCGHGSPAKTILYFDITATIPAFSVFSSPSDDNVFPPIPDEAVASADPGEILMPPENLS